MRKIAWLIGIVTLGAAGFYMVVSLQRWEWNRALFFGLVVVIAEVGLATALVLRKLEAIASSSSDQRPDPQVLARLRESRPRRDRFEWLGPTSGRMGVFITLLIGGGVIISGLAWVVDKVAANTTSKAGEERLARDLGRLSFPRGGLVVDDVTVLAESVPGCDDPQLRKLLRRSGYGGPE